MSKSDLENELRTQFKDLQLAVMESKEKMKQIDGQLEHVRKINQRNKLVKSELSQLSEQNKSESEIRMYMSVGRMFVLKPYKGVDEEIDKVLAEHDGTMKKLADNKTYLEQSLKEKENNLRDFINQNIKS